VFHGKEEQKKVYTRNSPKYTSSSDDDDSSELVCLRALERSNCKVNELIKAINEKDELLKKQEGLIIDETKKNEKLEKALAHEKEKINFLTHGLISCNDSISSLQCANDDLNAKIVKLNDHHASSSSIEHVSICTKCKYVDVDACIANVSILLD
jgi:septal ring factor EnvC (AmiA/AmiB activator)